METNRLLARSWENGGLRVTPGRQSRGPASWKPACKSAQPPSPTIFAGPPTSSKPSYRR